MGKRVIDLAIFSVDQRLSDIQCRDTVLDDDLVEWVTDESGRPVTHWDGRNFKTHPITGERVPDGTARVPMLTTTAAPRARAPTESGRLAPQRRSAVDTVFSVNPQVY